MSFSKPLNSLQKRFQQTLQKPASPWMHMSGATPSTRPVSAAQMNSRMDQHHLPQVEKPRQKRQRSAVPRKISQATWDITVQLIEQAQPSLRTAVSNFEEFMIFIDLNDPGHIVSHDLLLLLYALDCQVQGQAATTTRTYAKNILRVVKRDQKPLPGLYPFEGPHVEDLFKILEQLIADEEVEHALDLKVETAKDILTRLSGRAQATVWLMCMCGARAMDLSRLKRDQIQFDVQKAIMRIHFTYTKGRRTDKKQFSLSLKLEDDFPVPQSLVALLNVPSDQKLNTCTAAEINVALDALGPVYDSYTSYSFRRLFVHRVIARFRDGETEMVAWGEVVKLTAHVSIETVRSSYAEKFQDTL